MKFNCPFLTLTFCIFKTIQGEYTLTNTSQQHASVCQGWICLDNCTCCHTETEVADQTCYRTQSQYTDIWPTSPNTDPIAPVTRKVCHKRINHEVTSVTPQRKAGSDLHVCCSSGRHFTARPPGLWTRQMCDLTVHSTRLLH